MYLYALIQTLEGVDVQSLFAGLQTGNDFLTLDLPWSDGQSRQAAPEVLSETRLGHLPTYTHNHTHTYSKMVHKMHFWVLKCKFVWGLW